MGALVKLSEFSVDFTQGDAWAEEIDILQGILEGYEGKIYFEYNIPRMGKRVDVILLIGSAIFVLEFKIGSDSFTTIDKDQVWDYALDLKNFHETSHISYILPILISTDAKQVCFTLSLTPQNDNLFFPIEINSECLKDAIEQAKIFTQDGSLDIDNWENGRYSPTPTIIEAARALYNKHSVSDLARNDAGAINLTKTSKAISDIIKFSKENCQKSICFVTGVPGAGKTLVGLDIATAHDDKDSELYSVYLSGNGPLVMILSEALARDKVQQAKSKGEKLRKGEALSQVKSFIQNIHHFRDEYLRDSSPPPEHVVLFDEAQRAWHKEKTIDFMKRKKRIPDFKVSEPEFLISCLDRHQDWAVIVCLVGGGQEIHSGEAGISEWIQSMDRSFKYWNIYISPRLTDSEYDAASVLQCLGKRNGVEYNEDLHLSVSLRSFRAENVSLFVKQLLDNSPEEARSTLSNIKKFPIVLTRSQNKAKEWLRSQARGSERYGIIVSSQAQRLKPYAIDVKSPMDPKHWFLDGKDDVRSSYYLEDVATEFHVQGLELDWACITWDADFRRKDGEWENWEFRGDRWNRIRKDERKLYQKNAYRVLLTRARQGIIIVVPEGDKLDHTREPEFYNGIYEYLKEIGIEEI